MLRVPYCHLTFTLPHELNGLARRYPTPLYNLLLRTAWKTICSLCEEADHVGGKPGMTAVLHIYLSVDRPGVRISNTMCMPTAWSPLEA